MTGRSNPTGILWCWLCSPWNWPSNGRVSHA
jgi:hypothetical protein